MGSFRPKITNERIAIGRSFLPANWPRGDYVPFRNGRIDWAKIGVRTQIMERQHNLCHWCGRKMSMDAGRALYPTLDHVVPLYGGGADHPDNLVLAHARCNELRTPNPRRRR